MTHKAKHKKYLSKLLIKALCGGFLTLYVSSCIYHNPSEAGNSSTSRNSSSKLEDPDLEELPLETRLGITQNIPVPEIELSPDEILITAEEQEAFDPRDFKNSMALEQYEHYPKVKKWIKYFKTKGRKSFQRYLDRGHYYKPTILKLLKQQGLPNELYYMALIESGFNTSALSSAKAMGIWQFIPATGKRYGLRIDRYVDERKDPIRATLAAASYLNDLKNVFDSWFLAMASFNMGETRNLNLIMLYKTRNYWVLSEQKRFPKETANYVPKFIAAYLLGENLEKHGFKTPSGEHMPDLISISLPSPVKISDIAKKIGLSTKDIKKNNPHLHSNITPTYLDTYRIWFERAQTGEKTLAKLDDITVLPRESISPGYYRIRRGDTLGRIAKKFGLSVKTLKLMNGLRSNRIVAGKKLLVSSAIKHETPDGKNYFKYTVRRGDSLFSLAKRYKTTVKHLKRINSLRSSMIKVGQRIKIGKG